MGFKKLFNYMVMIFISGLGLFNSTQLEVRYEPGTNNELFFQNGQIISTAFMGLFIAAFLVEVLIMRRFVPSSSSDKKVIKKEKEFKNSEKKSDSKKPDSKKSDSKKIEEDSSEIIAENTVPKND
jgi:hypothetical protein